MQAEAAAQLAQAAAERAADAAMNDLIAEEERAARKAKARAGAGGGARHR